MPGLDINGTAKFIMVHRDLQRRWEKSRSGQSKSAHARVVVPPLSSVMVSFYCPCAETFALSSIL